MPHQVQGAVFLTEILQTDLRSALLADETSLGKTIQALTADDLLRLKTKDALEKAELLASPADEFVEFLPEKRPSDGLRSKKLAASKQPLAGTTDTDTNESNESDLNLDSGSEDDDDDDTSDTEEVASNRAKGLLYDAYYSRDTGKAMKEAIKENETKIAEEGIEPTEFADMMIKAKELREEGARDMRYETRVPKGVLGVSIWDEVHKLKNV
ncbi:hypothetical protein LTR56_025781 [Elasticomyces elasticus]|nr:hypothetical protein LTR56_025781 [Elasticomyces elasticus]